MDYPDCDAPATLYSKRLQTSRTDVRCHACREVIPAHYRYARVAMLYDGAWTTLRRCARCEAIHAHLAEKRRGYDDWPSETLDCGHEYAEVHGRPPPDDIAALAFALPGDDL